MAGFLMGVIQMAGKKMSLASVKEQLHGARVMAQAFGSKGMVPEVLEDHIARLEDSVAMVPLEEQLIGLDQIVQNYEGSQTAVPADLREQTMKTEAKLAGFSLSKGKDRLG